MRNRLRRAKASRLNLLLPGMAATALLVIGAPADANHSWNGYHWARSSTTSFTVTVGSNVNANWLAYVQNAVGSLNQSNSSGGYWSLPSYSAGGVTVYNPVRTKLVTGSTTPRTCKPKAGTVQTCNASYGFTGWLGVAQVWTSGSHITQATVKLNDSYFNLSTYNTPDWRATVTCQEIGHTFGLDHQDENQTNPDLQDANGTQTCMDYTSWPQGNGQPNFHDYEELGIIYSHADSSTTLAAPSVAVAGDTPGQWGRAVAFTRDGRGRVFEAMSAGDKITTFVFWAPGKGTSGRP